MPRIRYVGPIVGVDVVLVGLSGVEPGDEFDAPTEAAEVLLTDDTMYVAADAAAESIVAAHAAKAAEAQAAADAQASLAAADEEAALALAAADAQAAASESGTEITVDQTMEA